MIRVFIASPGDLAEERRAFKEEIDELNKGFGRGADVEFVPLGWEDALAQVGRRSQSIINRDVDACDAFVLIMWRRWGQEAPDSAPCTSYTEEEFYRALTRFEKEKKPEIFVLFKHIDPGQMADAGPQLSKVLAFRQKLEATRRVLYRGFRNLKEFKREVEQHLMALARGEIADALDPSPFPLLPESVAAEVEKYKTELHRAVEELEHLRVLVQQASKSAEIAKAEAKDALARAEAAEKVADARAATRTVDLAESAAKAALEGKVEEARQGFAKALDGTTDLRVLRLGFEFFHRIGELEDAEQLVRRWLAISGPDSQSAETAAAYGHLGVICDTRGDLPGAEQMYKKALSIDEKLGNDAGMARHSGNLGLVCRARGDLDGDEAMQRKALALHQKLGDSEGIARDYGNLGKNFEMRGDLDRAEEMQKQALLIDQRIGRLGGIIRRYGNLGRIYGARGDLVRAAEMHQKTLSGAEQLADKEVIAQALDHLGSIAQQSGRTTEARDLWTRAMVLYGSLGRSKDREKCQKALASL